MLRVETEQEREIGQQLKQANDTIARLLDELRGAADREGQQQMKLVEDPVARLQMLQKEFDAFLREKELKDRDSKISVVINTYFLIALFIINGVIFLLSLFTQRTAAMIKININVITSVHTMASLCLGSLF